MHELGVVFHIIRSVEKAAEENELTEVSKVILELGEVSTVIPEYLTDCWKWASDKNNLVRGASLEVETIPALTFCENCGKTYPTVEHGKICPYCESEKTWLAQGNEVKIKEIWG